MSRQSSQFARWMMVCALGSTMAFVLGASVVTIAAAPKKSGNFKVGDRVVQEWAGDKLTGKVISVDPNSGWLEVEYDDKQKWPKPWRVPASRLQKLPGKGAKATTKETAKGTAKGKAGASETNPFETVDERVNKSGPRTWSDTSGKFKIEATLVKLEEESVTLKRKDGKEISLPLEKLCDADQTFLRGVRGESDSEPAETDGEGGDDAEAFPSVEVATEEAQPLDVSQSDPWTYKPDAFSGSVLPDVRIGLGTKTIFESPSAIFYSAEKSKAAVIWANMHDKSARVQVCDLRSRKMESNGPFASGQIPVAMTGDMDRVAAVVDDWSSRATIYLYDVKGTKINPAISWKSSATKGIHEPKIELARFIDKNHLLTLNSEGHLVMWNLTAKVKAEYQIIKAALGTGGAFSANGKYFAVPVEAGIVLIESLTGKKVGFLPADELAFCEIAFDAQGKQLALAGGGRIRVWDLTTHELKNDFVTDSHGRGGLHWVDDNTLLVGGSAVIDVAHRVCIWNYQGRTVSGLGGTPVGGRFLCASGMENPVLMVAKIPNDEALSLVEGLKPDDLLVIKPGSTIALDVQLGGFQQHQAKVVEDLTKQIEANGMQVAPDGKVKLTVSVKPGEVKQQEFRAIGRGALGTQKYSVPSQITALELSADGKVVWKRGGAISVGFVSAQKDETVDAAINRQISESVASLGNTRMPRYIATLPDGKSPGTSQAP